MPTVEHIARAALGDLCEDERDVLLAVRWVTERYREFASRRLKQRRKVGSFTVPPAITAGVVQATNNSPIVTGSTAAQAAWAEARDLVGRFFQTNTGWYEILSVDPTFNIIELASPYAGDDLGDASYRIVQRYNALDPSVAFLGTFVHPRFRRPLRQVNIADLDLYHTERQFTSAGPFWVAEFDEHLGRRRVELYPYSTRTELIGYIYWEKVPDEFELEEQLPNAVDPQALKEGVMVDIYTYQSAKAAKEGKGDMAAYYGNMAARQRTLWERAQQRLVKSDRGLEDLHLVLQSYGNDYFDIRNARDEVYARGNRP